MPRIDVNIPAPDGRCPATLHLPDGEGPWPAVLLFPDAGGARETFREMADRVAAMGYATLLPDVYYRAGDWAPFDTATAVGDPEERARLGELMGGLTRERIVADSGAFLEFLLSRPEVTGAAVGTTGYCRGGRMSLIAAAAHPDRIAAAASFHGGRLAVADHPESLHRAADRIRATVYVAGAVEDGSFTAEQGELLRKARSDVGVQHTVEFYPARHGFAVPDNPTYDPDAAARHWAALKELYRAHFQG
ncbi:dienelactone hydrolase family protein (plasmid) [Pseudonocardia bannensis]|uniref:dienelactone hydrolase family protein n=1 Tax=Pseudonocardia bannensis TaxID=630973 RepID=UPI0028A9A080|nr:dienelactone hydrolase family protein [Pseudonocardia bannensis]